MSTRPSPAFGSPARPSPDHLPGIVADLADPADPAERREALEWCLQNLILPAERRAALEARLHALSAEPLPPA